MLHCKINVGLLLTARPHRNLSIFFCVLFKMVKCVVYSLICSSL